MFLSEDGGKAAVFYFKTLAEPACPIRRLHLAGLDPDAEYEITEYFPAEGMACESQGEAYGNLEGRSFYGDELMQAGLTVEKADADFAGYLWVLERKQP
jgi:alpha-galactosidase